VHQPGEPGGRSGANVLQLTPRGGAPTLKPTPDATWGLHLVDANIALGNLTDLVRAQAASYLRRNPPRRAGGGA
jgi:hypothetical protein